MGIWAILRRKKKVEDERINVALGKWKEDIKESATPEIMQLQVPSPCSLKCAPWPLHVFGERLEGVSFGVRSRAGIVAVKESPTSQISSARIRR